MSACVCCGTDADLRFVNLPRGGFALCRDCRGDWEDRQREASKWAVEAATVRADRAEQRARAAFALLLEPKP